MHKIVTIPLAPRTARAVDLCVGERQEGPLLLNHDGTRRLDRHAATRIVKRLARRGGIDKKISPHSLRHSFITAALDAGVALRDVQEAASHADPRTTMHRLSLVLSGMALVLLFLFLVNGLLVRGLFCVRQYVVLRDRWRYSTGCGAAALAASVREPGPAGFVVLGLTVAAVKNFLLGHRSRRTRRTMAFASPDAHGSA